ncbi:MAG: OmpA family protein [Chitinophagales bacterium]|nr:OmpA family protein [Chitinophagales bacterium]
MKIKPFIIVIFLCTIYANAFSTETSLEAKDDKSKTKSKKEVKQYTLETNKFLKDWNLILHGGATMPYTDIRSYDWFRQFKKPSEVQWGAGIGLTKMFGSAFGINVDYTLGKVSGRTLSRGGFAEDRDYWNQLGFNEPVYFKTNVFHQATVNFYLNWMGLSFGYNKFIKAEITGKPIKERRFALYNKIGIGMIRAESNIYNVSDDLPIDNSSYLRGYTNKYTEVVFPLTTGMKFKVNKSIDIGMEGTFTFTNSDKLDAFNFQTYIDNQGKTVNSLSKINRDAYAYMNVNITYKFGRIGSQKEHVEWVNPMEMMMVYHDKHTPKPQVLLDTDGDGVLDIVDQEPNTPAGYPVDAKGVTLDSDKDGCVDALDPEPYSNPNLPIVDCKNVIDTVKNITIIEQNPIKEVVKETIVEKETKVIDDEWKLSSIYFDLNKYNITPEAATELKKVAQTMQKKSDLIVEVQGHTDTRGSMAYNQKLSENRVNAAINYLIKNYGIDANRFKKLPMGMVDPTIKDAQNENQHQVNRRVDFKPASGNAE